MRKAWAGVNYVHEPFPRPWRWGANSEGGACGRVRREGEPEDVDAMAQKSVWTIVKEDGQMDQGRACFERKGSAVPREIDWTHKVGHAHGSRPASQWASFHGRAPNACGLGGRSRDRSRTEQTSRLLIPASLACRRWKFSARRRHSGLLPRKANAVARDRRSLLMISAHARWTRRSVRGHVRVLTKRRLEISVLHAVRVCLLGLVRYGRTLPRHGRE